jgi:hypothetical protein
MNGILADVRLAVRSFRRAPGFYSVVVAILGLGIASSVAIFALLDGILLRPLPYRDPQRLVMLTGYAPLPPFDSNGSLSYNDFLQFTASARSFADVACTFRTGWSRVTLNSGSEPVNLQAAFVSPNLFTMFGRKPLLGRTFTVEENLRGERVVVISEGHMVATIRGVSTGDREGSGIGTPAVASHWRDGSRFSGPIPRHENMGASALTSGVER